jgi:signal transduction histidine kinase
MLSRLGIRQKLAVLLVIPLLAVAAVLVPFTAERIDDARSAGVTARTADAARQVGALIQALQQERLLAVGYLATPALDRNALLSQTQEAQSDEAALQSDPATAAILATANKQLTALDGVRAGVQDRTISASRAYDAYRSADVALLDALNLDKPNGADAAGLTPLGALDALMRSNEEASSVGALLVAAAADPAFSRSLLVSADTIEQEYRARFRDLADPSEVSLVDTVDNGAAGTRLREILAEVNGTPKKASLAEVGDALTAAVTYTSLRRLAQDRAARNISNQADQRASTARTFAWVVGGGAAVLFAVVVALGITISTSISRPLRRLTRAARVVADLARAELVRVADSDTPDPAPPRLAAVEVDSTDEIGELATALNRVQATAALLLERQTTSRRNIAVMFANIARRTQNLVGRQLILIDDLERNERSAELLQRLYRLDHVATRLRRSADSLLVVSGTIDQLMSGVPTRLDDVVRASLAEIEGYQMVELGEICTVAVAASLVADLRLLLAELLENATNFSPPTSTVTVSASMDGDDCFIAIVDNGLGMSATRLEEENRRLVERERLELAPTNVLGLFVVGRIARRHGLGVRLDPSVGRGVTVQIRVPGRLLTAGNVVGLPAAPMRTRPAPHPAITAIDAVEVDESGESFPWFQAPEDDMVAISSMPDTTGGWGPPPTTHGPSIGRASLPTVDAAEVRPGNAASSPPRRPSGSTEPPPPTRGGLTRRVPGTHLSTGAEDPVFPAATQRSVRDPEAEREALNDYLSGLARGDNAQNPAERHS